MKRIASTWVVLLVSLSVWAELSGITAPNDYSIFKNLSCNYSDKIYVPTSGAILTEVEKNSLTSWDSIKIIRTEYSYKAKAIYKNVLSKNEVEEIHAQDFIYAEINDGSETYQYFPILEIGNVVDESFHDYSVKGTISESSYRVTYDKLSQSFYHSYSKNLNELKNDKLIVRFRVGVYFAVKREGEAEVKAFYIATQETKDVYLYSCHAGEIGFSEDCMPVLDSKGGEMLYALYPTAINGNTPAVDLVSVVPPSDYREKNQQLAWSVYMNGVQKTQKNTSPTANSMSNGQFINSGSYFDYVDLADGNKDTLDENTIYDFERTIILQGDFLSCSSDRIKCKVVKLAHLSSLSEKERYVCVSNGDEEIEFESSVDKYDDTSKWVYVKGEKLNVERLDYADLYGVKYMWEYRKRGGDWFELPLSVKNGACEAQYNSPEGFSSLQQNNPQDLVIPLSLIKQGKVYEFRQVVYLTGFKNRKVYAKEGGVIKITTYDKISEESFDIKSMGAMCADNSLREVKFRVDFSPETNKRYKYQGDGSQFLFEYQFPYAKASEIFLASNLERSYNLMSGESQIAKASVVVTDGCGNEVKLVDSVTFERRPSINLANILCGNSDTVVSDGELIAEVAGNETNILRIAATDEDFYACDYLYSEDGENYRKMGSRGVEVYLGTQSNKRIYLKKKSKNGCQCESDVVAVTFHKTGALWNNRITNTLYYVCENAANPAIKCDQVCGGYGEGTYSYKWLYSTDDVVYRPMLSNDLLIETPSLDKAKWSQLITQPFYIKRVVFSKKGTGIISDTSECAKILPYSKPLMTLIPEATTVCFDSLVTLSMSQDSLSLSQLSMSAAQGRPETVGYSFLTKTIEEKDIYQKENMTEVGNLFNIRVSQDTVVYAKLDMCGASYYSPGVMIKSGVDLKPRIANGNCRVRGGKMKVSVLNANPNWLYSIEQDGEQMGSTSAVLDIPAEGSLVYKVRVVNGGCEHVGLLSLDDENLSSAFRNFGIAVNQVKGDVVTVCVGESITLGNIKNEVNSSATNYVWSVNGVPMESNDDSTLTTSFKQTGTSALVKRISKEIVGGELCQSIEDSVIVKTYGEVYGTTLALDHVGSVCAEDSVLWTIGNTKGGYQDSYKYELHKGDHVIRSGVIGVDQDIKGYALLGSAGTYDLSVKVIDDKCTDTSIYKYQTSAIRVTQVGSADFSLSASPSLINNDGTGKTTTVVINASVESGETLLDSFSYSYKRADGLVVTGTSIGGSFSIAVDSTAFTNDLLVIHVDRTMFGSACSASNAVTVSQTKGFSQRPAIVANQIQTSYCSGEKVVLRIPVLPNFGDKTLSASDVSYSWLKNGSLVGTSDSFMATAVANETNAFMCIIGYRYDKSMQIAQVYSEEYRLVGKQGVRLGNITDKKSGNRYLNLCKGDSVSTFTLEVDAELSPTDSVQWEQSKDGAEWHRVPFANRVDGITLEETTLNLRSAAYCSDLTPTYFRVVGYGECSFTTYSSNIFVVRVDTLPNVPVVVMRSSNLADEKVVSLSFSPTKEYAGYVFHWGTSEDDLNQVSSVNGAQVSLNGAFSIGENSIYVYKESISGAQCKSEVRKYDFKLYEELSIGDLFPDKKEKGKRCSGDSAVSIHVGGIKGGSEQYKAVWQYRTYGQTWVAFNETSTMPFTAKFEEIALISGYQFGIIVTGLSSTTSFRAVISCDSGYVGPSKTTNEFVVEYYEPLKSGSIDLSEEVICYGSETSVIKGELPQGGDGNYSYQWLKTTTPEIENSWRVISNACHQTYTLQDTLFETTYYKRSVTDGCGTRLESRAKIVDVLKRQEISPDDINYTKIVKKGSPAKMWGVPRNANDKSIYVWYDSQFQPIGETVTGDVLVTSDTLRGEKGGAMHIFYAAKLDAASGCTSCNYDTLRITAYSNEGGIIYVDGMDEMKEESFWVCPNDKKVDVRCLNAMADAEFEWSYRIVTNANTNESIVGDWNVLRYGAAAAPVTTAEVSLDTCNVNELFKNSTGRAKYFELRRESKFDVAGEDLYLYSNSIKVNVVPTLKSVSALYDVVGELTTEQTHYCIGDSALGVTGLVSEGSETMVVWKNRSKYFGPWLYDNTYKSADAHTTWFEYKTDEEDFSKSTIYNFDKNGYAYSYIPGVGSGHVMSKTYNIRRALSDGCTTVYTDELPIYVHDAVGQIGSVEMYTFKEDKRSRIYKGFEVGDSLLVGYLSGDAYDCMWSTDSLFSDTIEKRNSYCTFVLTEELARKLLDDSHIYLKRKSNGCWSSPLAIPIAFGNVSDGGKIGHDQVICRNSQFEKILNISSASGNWMKPTMNEMEWTYSWQFSNDSIRWSTIVEADSAHLPANLVNKYASVLGDQVTFFRRMAINDSARVRYSNVVKMCYYDELIPGQVYLMEEQLGYCVDDAFPIVYTTDSKGGNIEGKGIRYSWNIKIDNGAFYEYVGYRGNTLNLMFDDSISSLSRSENHIVGIKCIFSDGCFSVESNLLNINLFRENLTPNIYQDNDSCDAMEVTVKVISDNYDKSYIFNAYLYSEQAMDSVIWSSETTERTLKRFSNMVVDEYGVYSIDKNTGCVSGVNYFNIDSLPILGQMSLSAPEEVCYGEGFSIVAGPAIGGNGKKAYVWQYSLDSIDWNDYLNQTGEDLEVINPVVDTYYRRIVTDMCAEDTSDWVLVRVREKVNVNKSDLVLYDYKCEGRPINIRINDGVSPLNEYDYYQVYSGAEVVKFQHFMGTSLNGFHEDSIKIQLSHVMVDSLGKICESDRKDIYVHNAVLIDHERNVISCEDLAPCNGMFVEVFGDVQTGVGANRLINKWYISKDGENWTEQLLQNKPSLSVRVEDTMYVKRILFNGCINDTSNVVTIIGSKVTEYDYLSTLKLNVVSNVADSNVTMNVMDGKNFSQLYYFVGDGEMPSVQSNSVVLPYNAHTYMDSILQLIAVSEVCVSQYNFHPLRGGLISFDGDTLLCGGSDIPSIVATDIEGGHGNYTYQWQYMNQFTGNFINIEGATAKEYVPKAVSVATTYRRVTTDGEYTSISNAITISIRPLPKVRGIFVPQSDSALAVMGLKRTQYSVERLPSMELTLLDSISDVDAVIWQKSLDAVSWENLETQDANLSSVYSIPMADTTNVVYFRAVGISSCGTDTTKPFKVTTLYASFVTDEELVLVDSVCSGDPYVRISYKSDYSDIYEYSYRPIGFHGDQVLSVPSYHEMDPAYFDPSRYERRVINDTTKVAGGAVFTYPTKSFDVEITRYVKSTGASSTKMVHFFVDEISASFSYLVDDIESHVAGADCRTVRINQGSRVVFTPTVTSSVGQANYSYKWWLEDPSNVDYYTSYGGSEGRDGLTSMQESPVCYFYNPLNYAVKLQVSDGLCTSTVTDCGLYIDKGTFRSYQVDALFEEDEMEPISVLQSWTAYPNPCTDWLYVDSDSDQPFYLFDMMGTLLFESIGGESKIDMRPYAPGLYLLQMDGQSVKVLKK